jgi:mitogen-activated protein kinase 7
MIHLSVHSTNAFCIVDYIGSIAQEVMSYKSSKEGHHQLQQPSATLQAPVYGSNLRRKDSMSVQDRETLERSKQAAAQTRSRPDSMGGQDNSVAAAAVANHTNIQHMEVEALERELSGHT